MNWEVEGIWLKLDGKVVAVAASDVPYSAITEQGGWHTTEPSIYPDPEHMLQVFVEEITRQKKINKFLSGARKDTESENKLLRCLLWLRHGHDGLYGDDGEMQCSTCKLDYKRDSAEEISQSYVEQGKRTLHMLQANLP